MLVIIVISEVHVILAYFTLHVTWLYDIYNYIRTTSLVVFVMEGVRGDEHLYIHQYLTLSDNISINVLRLPFVHHPYTLMYRFELHKVDKQTPCQLLQLREVHVCLITI